MSAEVAAAAEALDQTLTTVEEALYQTRSQSRQDPPPDPISTLAPALCTYVAAFNRRVREQDVPAVVIKTAP